VTHLRSILAIARADFLERVRRYSFLLTLFFAVFLGYAAATGRISIQLGGYRGVFTSAWIGALVALTTTCFISLVGFYIVKGALDRDRQTGVGQILAATPLSKPAYTLGKFLSNFAVLAAMVVIMALAAVVMQLTVGEDPHFHVVALLAPFLLIAIPAMLLTAGAAVLFETLPLLRGGIGDIVWFFAWAILGVGLPEMSGVPGLDPMGVMTMSQSMMAGARAHIPGYENDFAFTIADTPTQVVQSFQWQGVLWTGADILLRIGWGCSAILFVLLAALVFDRFDASRALAPTLRRTKAPKAVAGGAADSTPADAGSGALVSRVAPVHLSPLAAGARTTAFGRIFAAELRLAIKGLRWWWYIVAAGLVIAQYTAPLQVARGPILGSAWMWAILIWSAMGAREARFATGAILFSSARILPRQLPACWLVGFCVAGALGAAVALRVFFAQGILGLVPWLAGAVFLPSLALALGVWSGTGKPFEGILTAMWYIGPLNHSRGIDFTGTGSGAHAIGDAVVYFVLSAALLAAAFVFRARQLRSN
jgi:hypothetical protein